MLNTVCSLTGNLDVRFNEAQKNGGQTLNFVNKDMTVGCD